MLPIYVVCHLYCIFSVRLNTYDYYRETFVISVQTEMNKFCCVALKSKKQDLLVVVRCINNTYIDCNSANLTQIKMSVVQCMH